MWLRRKHTRTTVPQPALPRTPQPPDTVITRTFEGVGSTLSLVRVLAKVKVNTATSGETLHVTVTGPTSVLDNMTCQTQDGVALTYTPPSTPMSSAALLQLLRSPRHMMSVIGELLGVTRQRCTITAIVPKGTRLHLDAFEGDYRASGTFQALLGSVSHDATVDVESIGRLHISGLSESAITVRQLNGPAQVSLTYNCQLQILSGQISRLTLRSLSESTADIRAACGPANLNLTYNCVVSLRQLNGNLAASMLSESHLTVTGGEGDSAVISCTYNCVVNARAVFANASLRMLGESFCTLGGATQVLHASLTYNCGLDVGSSIQSIDLRALSESDVQVSGRIGSGRISTTYDCTVQAQSIGPSVVRHMGSGSRLLVRQR